MESSQVDRVGLVLNGRYRITEQLGEGGMGQVYRGERLQLGRPVAIKFLHSPYAHSPRFVARFQREARAMSKLSHPYCVSVLDFGVHEAPYIVMDFVTGSTLRDVLDRGRVAPQRALHITRQLLAGLAHAHGQGVIHRDIKPGNIMLGEAVGVGDHVRIFDFGLAKLHDPELDGDPSVAAIVGTPAYMAPEQARADKVDERADLYASGVVLFEMLTGQKPFQGDDAYQVLVMQRDKPPPRLRQLAPELSPELENLVAKALEKDPERRFQTAAAFVEAIETVPEWSGRPSAAAAAEKSHEEGAFAKTVFDARSSATSREQTKPIPVQVVRRKRRGGFTGGLVVLLAVSGLAVFGFWKLRRGEAASVSAAEARDRASSALKSAAEQAKGAWQALKPPESPQSDPVVPAEPAAEVDPDLAAVDEAGDAGELSEAILAAADEALNDTRETEATIVVPPASVPQANSLGAIHKLIAEKKTDAAIAGIQQLRRKTPKAAQLPYLLGNLYFEKGWRSDGLAKYREAIKLQPSFRQNTRIHHNAIEALGNNKTYARARAFLVRDVGRSATMSLRRAAKSDPSKDVRKRAASVLKAINR